MKNNLQERRKAFGYTQRSFAEELGVSLRTYQPLENTERMPRKKLMMKIMKLLNTDSILLFEYTKDKNQIKNRLLEYLNTLGDKAYSFEDLQMFRKSMKLELEDRKNQNLDIKSRSEEGKKEINKRTAIICNKTFKCNYTAEDIKLFKKCLKTEFTDRTGKSTWGIEKMKKYYEECPRAGVQ